MSLTCLLIWGGIKIMSDLVQINEKWFQSLQFVSHLYGTFNLEEDKEEAQDEGKQFYHQEATEVNKLLQISSLNYTYFQMLLI